MVIVLAANKCDSDDKRVVTKAMGEQLAASKGIPFFETSAKSGVNITEVKTLKDAHTHTHTHTPKLQCPSVLIAYCYLYVCFPPPLFNRYLKLCPEE